MKKKILAIVLCVAMLAIAIVGGTMAYFTDNKAVENTFTVGNVAITLTEAEVEQDTDRESATYGDWLKKGEGRVEVGKDYGKLYPGQTIYKDPTITNTGSEKAYVAAKITVTSDGDIHSYENDDGTYTYMLGVAQKYDNININVLASGGMVSEQASSEKSWNNLYPVYETATCTIYQEANRKSNTYVFYVFVTEAMAKDASVTLFTQLHIPEAWNNAEMAGFENFKINVEAFATQEYGFADCFTAITTAFPNDFKF